MHLNPICDRPRRLKIEGLICVGGEKQAHAYGSVTIEHQMNLAAAGIWFPILGES